MNEPELLWARPPDVRERSQIGRYLTWLEARGRCFDSYEALWQWSVDDLEGFWGSIWEFFALGAAQPSPVLAGGGTMPGARWCPGVTLNYAERALHPGPRAPATAAGTAAPAADPATAAGTAAPAADPATAAGAGSTAADRDGDRVAVLARSQTRDPIDWTYTQLREQAGRVRHGLVRLGVRRGDRVAAYLPNIPETLAAFLATASLGAIWSSCAPEFGTRSVIDRFAQIAPKVLLCVDGYRYGTVAVSRRAEVEAIRQALPTLVATVLVPYLNEADAPPQWGKGFVPWATLTQDSAPLAFEPVPFDHPLYVLYSSGTTGLPKPIVHGHGGILLEHLKALALHADLGAADRFFWFTTTGWMMWNLLVSGLLVDAAIVLFDGNPGYPDLSTLWNMASETGTTYFGVSAPYLMSCRKAGLEPAATAPLGALRGVGSTGSPLPAEGFRWVYSKVGTDLLLASVSGGTDVCTAFVGGCPLVPVYAGEIPCRYLGAAVEAFDSSGRPCPVGETGELVVTRPMPSMPVGFWGDEDGSRYRAAYFEQYPGVWRHGDWITFTPRGTCVISGRSDATLNRGGVRVGTAEFYSVVEAHPEIADSLVVHLEDAGGGPGELLLFVVLAPGAELDTSLADRLKDDLRSSLSPRHVPDSITAVAAVPRTLSGKKLEVPVKRILQGVPVEKAASRGALVDPRALAAFELLRANRTPEAERRS